MMRKIFDKIREIRLDDWMHFTMSLVLCYVLATLLMLLVPRESLPRFCVASVAVVLAVGAGVYKEVIIDENVSFADLRADLFGAVVGAIMSWL